MVTMPLTPELPSGCRMQMADLSALFTALLAWSWQHLQVPSTRIAEIIRKIMRLLSAGIRLDSIILCPSARALRRVAKVREMNGRE